MYYQNIHNKILIKLESWSKKKSWSSIVCPEIIFNNGWYVIDVVAIVYVYVCVCVCVCVYIFSLCALAHEHMIGFPGLV